MRIATVLTLAAVAAVIAGPAASADLVYRHDRDNGPDLLEGSNGRPYWVLLSECAGFYGALANRASSDADYERDLAAGRSWLNLAIDRVSADRGLGRREAIALVEPRISRARSVGESSIAASSDDGGVMTLGAGDIMRSTCGSLERVYRAQAR